VNYNPKSPADRKALAEKLEALFARSKFVKVSDGSTEDVYEFAIPQIRGARIVVFSSIFNGAVRDLGADAIRVAVLYRRKDGKDQSLSSETRVHRTGEINKIVARTYERMRSSYVALKDRHNNAMRCHSCGAPLFTSSKGNEVCAETCWVK
jgi:hypothetical protein